MGECCEAHYDEGLLVGYRYYDAKGLQPAFPFGHGLSYTTFKYSDVKVVTASDSTTSAAPRAVVSVTVTNSGPVPGADAPQLYLSFPASAGEPPKVLRGFQKTKVLAPSASTVITFDVTDRDVSVWSTHTRR